MVEAVKKILFLAANPRETGRLSLDEEEKAVRQALALAKQRDNFELITRGAVDARELRQALLDENPHVVHFSGHGTGADGLVLHSTDGKAKLVSTPAIAELLKLFSDKIECVLLNACYSEVQAKAIAQHIPYVIGMNEAVGDAAAREFAIGFYEALGAGRDIEFAYQLGCKSIDMAGIPEELTPVLLKKEKIEADGSFNPESSAAPPVVPELTPQPSLVMPTPDSGLSNLPPISVDLEELGGQVPLASPFYIERPTFEQQCYKVIAKPGALIRVKAPRQMGKSSLTLRILDQAVQQGYRSTWLNLREVEKQFLENPDGFLKWLCSRISQKLGLEDRVEQYWQGPLGGNNKCANYFELYILKELKVPFALVLDEVDQLFQHEAVARNFFGLLRAWHEESKLLNSVWQNLRLILAHSKEVYIPLNIHQSPFNVGLSVELPPLNNDQVADLIHRHGLSFSPREAVRIMDLTGGHPYLLRVALYYLARQEISFAELMQSAPTAEWAYGEHLRHHLLSLQEHPELLAAMKRVIAVSEPIRIDVTEAFKLSSMGLVRFSGNDVVPLCDLYRQYFREMLEVSE